MRLALLSATFLLTTHLFAQEVRVIDGQTIPLNDTRYQAVVTIVSASTEDMFCGGTLIAPQWVVTAAHCLSNATPSNIKVNTGTYDKTNHTGLQSVKRVIPNPEYNPYTMQNDIGLIELSQEVNNITPLVIHKEEDLYDKEDAWVAGWGNISIDSQIFPDKLQEALVPIIDLDICNAPTSYNGFLNTSQICAGYMEGGKDSCQGDSGGPLVVKNENNDYELAGIVSFGGTQQQPCAAPNYPGIYTKVASYIEWISFYVPTYKTPTSLQPQEINNFHSGQWYLSGTTAEITDMSIFNNISILFIYQYGKYKAYSPNQETQTLLKNSGYEIIQTIPANSGIWIKK